MYTRYVQRYSNTEQRSYNKNPLCTVVQQRESALSTVYDLYVVGLSPQIVIDPMPKLRCSRSAHPESTWCGACRSEGEVSYFHRPICSGIQRVAVSTVLTEQPILCGVCNAVGVFRTHDGDCTSTMCEKCIAGHVSTQVEQRQDPLCCCGFVLPPGVIESLLVGNEDLLSS